ncbi:MAG: dihydroorotate dehydrogenase-like protein [Anaerolineae bacterium]
MIKLNTSYMGMALKSPLVASASPKMQELDYIKQLEDAGTAAVVLNSLYEEEIEKEREALLHYLEYGTESYAESLSFFPEPETLYAKTDVYLEHIRQAREAVDIPVIASLNGSSFGGWIRFAQNMEEAGASGIELNIYNVPTDPSQTGAQIEQLTLDIVEAVNEAVTIPVAVKLSPYFSNLTHLARQLDQVNADALVLFNRFYQPDINLETLDHEPNILLSTSYDMRLPLRWIGILYKQIKADMAATSGIHTSIDVIKMLMVGASVTMMTSAPLKHGPDIFRQIEADMRRWMTEHEYDSVEQMRGSMSLAHSPDRSAFERAQYMRGLKTYTQPTNK